MNAYLLCRDYLLTDMSPRTKRLMYKSLTTPTNQKKLAEEEGITQAAVSMNLRSSGASDILDGLSLIGSLT